MRFNLMAWLASTFLLLPILPVFLYTTIWCPPCCASGSGSESGSSGSEESGPPAEEDCCFGSEEPGEIPATLTATIESSCAAINGATVSLPRSGGLLVWKNNTPVSIGGGCLIGVTIIFECYRTAMPGEAGPPPFGCGQFRVTVSDAAGPGCHITIPSTGPEPVRPDTCSCDPFEFTFDGIITEDPLFPGSCVCCAVGAPVTVRITE